MRILRYFIIYLFIILCLYIYSYQCQESILSVSSFRSCASVDSRYLDPSTANNASSLINCTTDTDTLPQITVIDLRLLPGIGSDSNFIFNLTVVQNNQNGAGDVPSTSPNECQLTNPTLQTCVLTTPAIVNVQSTKIVYRYKLLASEIQIPYCYGSVSIFEQYKYTSQTCGQPLCSDNGAYDCADFTGCIPIQYPANSLNNMIYKKLNVLTQQTNTDEFILNTFKRVQEPIQFSPISCSNFQSSKVQNVVEYGDVCQQILNEGGTSGITNWDVIIQKQGNLRNITGGAFNDNSAITLQQLNDVCFTNFPYPDSFQNLCRQSVSEDGNVVYDNPNFDVRVPAFMPMPSIYGTTPSPVYRNLIKSPVHSAYDINLPVNITSLSLDIGYVGYACAGYDCAGNQDIRRIQATQTTSPGITFELFAASQYFNSINSIVSLGPKCFLYYITPEPEVFAEITINVTSGDHTETLTIDNFNPSGSDTSEPYRYLFGRIENIQTPTGILGPSIQGGLLLCGQEDDVQFVNMQCLIAGVNCNSDQTVDLENSPGFSETTNPWKTIMETSLKQSGFEERTEFYPHPYDYMIPTDANGKDKDAKYIPNDHGQTFWYFVDNPTLFNQFGADCNKIGMAQGVNSMQQNANLFCNLEPHSCVPGLGQFANGGLKTAVPCKVSQFFNFASNFYSSSDIPFPYGGFNADDQAQFIHYMKNNATKFMPNNQFLQTNADGTVKSLYDPKNPQWWIGYGGPNSGGQFLYYSPTTTNGIEYNTNVAVELTLDIVGTFVGYEAEVSKGQLDPTQSICLFVQGSNNEVAVYAENPSLQGVGVTTNYIITLDCNPPGQQTGFTVDTIPNSRAITLAPGESQYVNFTTVASNSLPNVNKLGCIATMLYADVVVNASCSQVVIDCGIQISLPDGSYSLGGPTPPIPNQTFANCSGFCDLSCYVRQGTPYESGCFWLAIIIPIILALACIGTGIGACYYYCYKVGDTSTSISRSNQFLEKEEKETRKIFVDDDQKAN